MPPLRLTSLLQASLPDLSPASRAVVSTLACRNGHAPTANEVATWVGLQNRYQLARLLRHDGLPPLEQLAGWTRVLYWLQEAEATGASLLRLAHRDGIDPAAAYRLVRRTTGMRWSEVRRAGLAVLMLRLRDRCRIRVVGSRFRARAQSHDQPLAVAGGVGVVPVPRRSPPTASPTPRRLPGGLTAARLAVAGHPFDVAVAGADTVWVTCLHAATVACVQLDPLRIVGCIPVGAAPTRIVCGPAGTRAYVTNQFSDDVGVIDVQQRRQTATIPVPGNPLGAVLTPDGRTLYVTTNLDRLYAVWLTQGRVTLAAPLPYICTHVVLHPSGNWLYVSTWKGGAILEVDAGSLRPRRAFTVGGDVQDMAVSSDGVSLYVANEKGWLDVLHLSTGRHIARVSLPSPAFGLALSRDDAVLYVGLIAPGRVVAVDCRRLRVVAALETGGGPRRMALDPSGRILVVANDAGWVDVVR